MVASIFYEPLGIVLTQNNQRLLRPFLWQIGGISKSGRDAQDEEACLYHMVRGAEMCGQYRLNFDFLWYECSTYTNFRRELIEKMRAARVIQKNFMVFRYNPQRVYCRYNQVKFLLEMRGEDCSKANIDKELLQLEGCDDDEIKVIESAKAYLKTWREIQSEEGLIT